MIKLIAITLAVIVGCGTTVGLTIFKINLYETIAER
jgi:hypothetical protein